MRSPKPGDNITDFFTTRFYNELRKRNSSGQNQSQLPRPHVPVGVMGSSSTAIGMYEPVVVSGPMLSNPDPGELEYNPYYEFPACSVSASGLTDVRLAVTQGIINTSQPAMCLVLGLTWVKAEVTDLAHPWLTIKNGALKSDESKGRAYIIIPPPETGVGYCFVQLGNFLPTTVQTVITKIRVTAEAVQYKTRDLLVYADKDEVVDWIDLPTVVCPEVP